MRKYLIVGAALAAATAVGFSVQAGELKSKAMTDQQLDQVVAGMTLYINKAKNLAVAGDGDAGNGRIYNGAGSNKFLFLADDDGSDCVEVPEATCTFVIADDLDNDTNLYEDIVLKNEIIKEGDTVVFDYVQVGTDSLSQPIYSWVRNVE